MTRPFVAGHKFHLDLVLRWHKLSSLGLEDFYHVCRYIYWRPPNMHQPDQFDLCQGHSSNRHFQWKSMGFHQNRHTVLRQLGLGFHITPVDRDLQWILQGISRIRSLLHHHTRPGKEEFRGFKKLGSIWKLARISAAGLPRTCNSSQNCVDSAMTMGTGHWYCNPTGYYERVMVIT